MVAVFFMKSALIKPVPLEKGATMNASWYVNTCLPQVFSAVSERRETQGLRSLIFHDDNPKSHQAWITNEVLLENHVKQYQNPAYFPALNPCDFFLFPKLKKQLLRSDQKFVHCYWQFLRPINIGLIFFIINSGRSFL